MPSNLRAKSIEGHVADSAGNVLRNSQIIVKQATPYGSITVDTVISDDDGYFQTKPLPNGIYDIYESGISISRTVHTADRNAIQCFKPGRDNYDTSLILNFLALAEAATPILNSFKYFLQIEPEELDISIYGSTFPIYDLDIATKVDLSNELYNIAKFFNLTIDSRITTTRFDIEYFAPLTALSGYYKRIRWAGVPGIRFTKDSRLVIPLDYFSIVANLPKLTSDYEEIDDITAEEGVSTVIMLKEESSDTNFEDHVNKMIIGDIVRLTVMGDGGGQGPVYFYGLVVAVDRGTLYQVTLEKWLSSRFLSDLDLGVLTNPYVIKVESFDGMFQGITDISDEVNERFTLVENINAQNYISELYNYNNQ